MTNERIFNTSHYAHWSAHNEEKGRVTEISVTSKQSVAVWTVRPGQRVPTHLHPDGQDTWIMLKGELTYDLGNGEKKIISAGYIAVAQHHEIHGALNEGSEDALFISIYSAPHLAVELTPTPPS